MNQLKRGPIQTVFIEREFFREALYFVGFCKQVLRSVETFFPEHVFFLNRTLTQISAFQGRKTVTFLLFIDNWMSVCSFDLWKFLVFLCLFLQDIFCTSNCADLNLLPPIWEPIFHHWIKNTQIGFDKTVKVSANENCCACLDFHRVEFE